MIPSDKDVIILRDRFLSFLAIAERMAVQGDQVKALDALKDDVTGLREVISKYLSEFAKL